jgi:cytochrome c553
MAMGWRALGVALWLGTAAAPQAAAQAAASAPERFASVCAACHGLGGVSEQAFTPTLAGQPSFYAITQLFLFREGRRASEAMTAVAKGMSDTDLRAFAEVIGKLPAPPAHAASAPDPKDEARAAALAARLHCPSCHGRSFEGGQQVPRLAGQREDYLLKTLTEFRAGTRVGYTGAMGEVLAGVTPDEIAFLASYLARFSKPAP